MNTASKKIGSLYINDIPVKPGSRYNQGDIITFGDAVPGKELMWLPIPGTTSWVTKSLVLTNISWRHLRDQKLVDGSPFIMDDNLYLVRLPRIGKQPQDQSELESVAFFDDGMRFWGYETFISFEIKSKPEQRCSVGSSTGWSSLHPAEHQFDLGFRPVIDIGISRP